MGLFDGITNLVSGALGGDASGGVGVQLMGALQEHGISGVSGLAAQFEQSGLGAHMTSWVGTGDNLPIDADSVQKVLGLPVVAALAAKMGVDPATASQMLAQHLPAIVNHMTPGGQVPA